MKVAPKVAPFDAGRLRGVVGVGPHRDVHISDRECLVAELGEVLKWITEEKATRQSAVEVGRLNATGEGVSASLKRIV